MKYRFNEFIVVLFLFAIFFGFLYGAAGYLKRFENRPAAKEKM